MKNLYLSIILIAFCKLNLNAQFEELFTSTDNNNEIQIEDTRVAFSQNVNATNHPAIIESLVAVPKDLVDMTGRWYSEKNDCVIAMQWDGSKWVGTILPETDNERFIPGEIIIELIPESKDEVYGRMKIERNKIKFRWVEVKYRVTLTKLKGSKEWEFYGK